VRQIIKRAAPASTLLETRLDVDKHTDGAGERTAAVVGFFTSEEDPGLDVFLETANEVSGWNILDHPDHSWMLD
jgi:hypothetical protein